MNVSTFLSTGKRNKLISDEVSYIVSSLILRTGIQVVFRIFGLVVNVINIIVFSKLGLSDSVTVSFFSLAVADLAYLLVFLISIIIGMPEKYFGINNYINLTYVGLAVMYYALMFLDISILVSIFVSFQKTCCVVLPFLFKSIFTRSRAIYTAGGIYLGVFAYYSPVYVTLAVNYQSVYYPQTNTTKIVLVFSPTLLEILEMNTTISKTILPIFAQAVMLICLFLMTAHLKKASEFRQSAVPFSKKQTNFKQTGKFESREVRVTQAIVVLCAIFVVANFPLVAIYITNLSVPDFSNLGLFRNLFRLCGDVSDTLFILNSSVNIFVYLKFNSKYREKFISLFEYRLKQEHKAVP